jgi:iron-sulfur cluster repair protein YtfE (RIC family)
VDNSGENVEDPRGRAVYEHLVQVHGMYRRELSRLRDEMTEWESGVSEPASRQPGLRDLRMHCARFCDALTAHHSIEDSQMFPGLRGYSPSAPAVVDVLESQHRRIAELLDRVEQTLVALPEDDTAAAGTAAAFRALADELEAHLDNEENSLARLFHLRAV